MNAPASSDTSDGNSEIARQLRNWWIAHRRGRVFDSSGGFFLPDGSMLSPDASYVTPATLSANSGKPRTRILHLCPDFVIELRSPSDSLKTAKAKMDDWMANGVALGWLIDPNKRRVFVYKAGDDSPGIISASQIHGSGPVEGFTLDLSEVWRCYEI